MMLIAHLAVVLVLYEGSIFIVLTIVDGILIIYARGVTAINIETLMRYCVNELLYITFHELFNYNIL